jgi:L-2-hydroxycarboxylate dehydrogenase (NAD+)
VPDAPDSYAADIRIDHRKLYDFGVRALKAVGVSDEHARMTCDVLILSDLRGIESHGFARFAEYYVGRSRNGRINLNADIHVVQDAPAAATIEADTALAFVPATHAMRLAMSKARATGIGMVAVRNSTHYGPASPYALMAIDQGMIGISMTTGGNGVVPPGGAKRVYGLNAISVAAPCRPPEAPFCLDMATSVIAAGKLEIARRRNKPVPEGWAIDAEGMPIVDANQYWGGGGGILPLGSSIETGAWKGFGLGVMVDILCGVLSGGRASGELGSGHANHFFGALRIDAFTTLESFYEQMDSMKALYRSAPRLPEAGPLTFPGEPEAAKEAEYRAKGIPYHSSTVEGWRKLAEEIGIEYDLE